MSGPQELIAGFLEGWNVDEPQDCARLLVEALGFMGFEVAQRYRVPETTDAPLATHCNVCGAKKGEDCRNVSWKSPALNRRFHMERETAFLHPRRLG